MGLFSQILEGDSEADIYDDPRAYGSRRLNLDVPEPLKRDVIKKLQPELEGKSVTGFLGNAAKDVGRFASGLGAILGQVLVHPIESAGAVADAALNPVDTAKMLAEPIIENYTPEEGESVPGMLLRRAYEHPFDSLMDASFIVGGPSGVAAKMAKAASFDRTAALMGEVSRRAAAMDPITQALKAGRYVMKTQVPDAYARMRTQSALADSTAVETTRQEFLMNKFNTGLQEAQAHLNPAEMMVRFPYAEGRIPIIKDDIITEITHRGTLESRKVQAGTAIRPEALDQFRDSYHALQQEYEVAAKISPEQVATGEALKAERQYAKMLEEDPAFVPPETVEDVYTRSLGEAQERSAKRAAKSTWTALDVAKEENFRQRVAQNAIEQNTFDLNEIAGMLPQESPTSMAEALELMGPKGGIIVPHSAEVLTRDQSTVRNILTKVGEANVYKENAGAMFRGGYLENLDPAAALSRSYRAAIRGDSFSKVADDAAQVGLKEGFVTQMGADWKPHMDADVRAGTHQPLHPGSIHLDGSVTEHFERLKTRLAEVAEFDDAAANVVLGDVAEAMANRAHDTFPLNQAMLAKVYKIPKSMGDELAFYKKSFEPSTNPLAQISDKWVMQPYNLLNLSAKGTRVLNNAYGNTEFIAMQGLHPFSFRGMDAMLTAGRAMAGRFGLLTDEVSEKLAGVFDLPGVSGGLEGTEAFTAARGLGQKLAEHRNPLVRTFGKYTEMISKANTNLEDMYRVASTIYELKPGGLESMRNIINGAGSMAAFADRVDELTKMGVAAMDEPVLKTAVKNMNRWLNDYKRTTAFERQVGRHVFPYHKFYKHSAELLMRFPFEKPVKAQLAKAIGGAAIQDAKDTLASYGFDWDTMVPDFMRDSIPISMVEGPDGTPSVMMLNTKGMNPFSFVAGNDVGEQGIGALHPLAKIAIEQATGINLFTREKFQGPMSTFSGRKVDPETGSITEDYNRPGLVDHYLRQFWPYQTLRELAAHGRVANDTADIMDLIGKGSPGTYQLDDRGLQRRKPMAFGAATPLVRAVGPVPQTLQMPTKQQMAGRKAITSSQFADLLQQHPEARERILAQLRVSAQSYRPTSGPVRPRRY